MNIISGWHVGSVAELVGSAGVHGIGVGVAEWVGSSYCFDAVNRPFDIFGRLSAGGAQDGVACCWLGWLWRLGLCEVPPARSGRGVVCWVIVEVGLGVVGWCVVFRRTQDDIGGCWC